jgi:hypothetical protein
MYSDIFSKRIYLTSVRSSYYYSSATVVIVCNKTNIISIRASVINSTFVTSVSSHHRPV